MKTNILALQPTFTSVASGTDPLSLYNLLMFRRKLTSLICTVCLSTFHKFSTLPLLKILSNLDSKNEFFPERGEERREWATVQSYTRPFIQVLEKLLSKFHEERAEVIVFSFSVQLLGIVQDYLVSRGYEHCQLDGSTKIEDRTQMVNTFNSDPTQFVFLISKK